MRQQNKLLGHLIRSDVNDIQKKVCTDENLRQKQCVAPKRSGRPRQTWRESNCNYAYAKYANDVFSYSDQSKINNLKQIAMDRKF